jgi:DNA modification methylase
MPESVTDRFTKKHEYIFFMVKSEKYYFDLDGIRDRHSLSTVKRYTRGYNGNEDRDYTVGPQNHMRKFMNNEEAKKANLEAGKNPGSVSDFWDITTKGNSEEHYAAYNDELIGKPIVAGCPKDGIVLDPFCGTATTGCRAIELGRKFIGIEGSSKYVELANRNIAPYIAQQSLF